jgi:hypothetical protein
MEMVNIDPTLNVEESQSARPPQKGAPRISPIGCVHTGTVTKCSLRNGTTGLHNDFGNSFSETFTISVGPGYRCANIQLAGWYVDFLKGDHHIDTVQVRISNVTPPDPATGQVKFTVSGYFRDQNRDDDFSWEVWYSILSLG